MNFTADEDVFYKEAKQEVDKVRLVPGLNTTPSHENVIHYSAMPWLNFTSLSHARSFSFADSAPKLSFGKMTDSNGVLTMPVSIHVHHALMDGYHVAQFFERFQELMNARS